MCFDKGLAYSKDQQVEALFFSFSFKHTHTPRQIPATATGYNELLYHRTYPRGAPPCTKDGLAVGQVCPTTWQGLTNIISISQIR
jgi:hypothetical protein